MKKKAVSMKRKTEVITFKVDETLLEAMKGISNRSGFIRSALLAALDNACPLCKGTGILTPKQSDHWKRFAEDHSIEECRNCHEMHLVCTNKSVPLKKTKRGKC